MSDESQVVTELRAEIKRLRIELSIISQINTQDDAHQCPSIARKALGR